MFFVSSVCYSWMAPARAADVGSGRKNLAQLIWPSLSGHPDHQSYCLCSISTFSRLTDIWGPSSYGLNWETLAGPNTRLWIKPQEQIFCCRIQLTMFPETSNYSLSGYFISNAMTVKKFKSCRKIDTLKLNCLNQPFFADGVKLNDLDATRPIIPKLWESCVVPSRPQHAKCKM